MLTKESLEFLLEMLNMEPTCEKIIIKDNKTGEVLCELSREDIENLITIENLFGITKDIEVDWTAFYR